MWKSSRSHCFAWFLDATSSILKDIQKQKSPFFYSFVFHDKPRKKIISIYDFVTTDNTQTSLECFMLNFKSFVQRYVPFNQIIPEYIVTDYSWALINSVLFVFNNCNSMQYLIWAFDYLMKENTIFRDYEMPTKIYICSTHFLKTVIKDVKSTNATEKQKKAFIFSFSLLQNSTSLKDFDETLKNILNVFFRDYIDQFFLNSLEAIRSGCLNRNIVKIDNDEEPKSQRNAYKDAENFIFEAGEIFGSLKKNSPFRDYFDRVISETLLSIAESDISGLKENPLKNMNLFSAIDRHLHVAPLWSGLLLTQHSRLTNNYVESYFKTLKTSILNTEKNGRLMPSELCSSLYRNLLSVYRNNYSSEHGDGYLNTQAVELRPKEPEERWKTKSSLKRKKGVFYSATDTFGYVDEEVECAMRAVKNPEFDNIFHIGKFVFT